MLINILIIILSLGYVSGALLLTLMEDLKKWYHFVGYFVSYLLLMWLMWILIIWVYRTDWSRKYDE